MQVELLNRRRWRTRIELANAIANAVRAIHTESKGWERVDLQSALQRCARDYKAQGDLRREGTDPFGHRLLLDPPWLLRPMMCAAMRSRTPCLARTW
jgi:hypothetical protein